MRLGASSSVCRLFFVLCGFSSWRMYYGAFGLFASLPGPSLFFWGAGGFGFLPDGLVLTPACFYDPLSFLYLSFQLQNHKNSTGVPRISALIFIKSILESLSELKINLPAVFILYSAAVPNE